MNRSILIVICDFLLLSLLTFSTDLSKVGGIDEGAPNATAEDAPKTADSNAKELGAVMKQALTEEQKNRELLQAELTKTRALAQQQQVQLSQREQQTQQLQQKQSTLEQQFAAAQANIQNLTMKLQSTSAEASMSKEQLAAREAEIAKQKAAVDALQKQLTQLNGQLQAAQTDKRVAVGQLAVMQQQVADTRAQNVRLSEGLKTLATNSSALTQEIRDNRAEAPNAIFSEFITNCVQANFVASRSGFLGMDASKGKASETILATDGANVFALCHVQDTPLTLWDPGTDWEGLTGTLNHDIAQVPIRALSFDRQDPRVVFMPVTAAEAAKLGCRIYPVASDPYKFQDAVVVSKQADYYGQCSFQLDLNTPGYVKLDRNLLKGLFGKFNPSRGDLVFSRNGELLGIMANNTYCPLLHFIPAATLQFGPDVRSQHTGDTLARMYSIVFHAPSRLQ